MKLRLIILLLLLVITGCKSNHALKYNQAIIGIEKELNPHIDEAISKFNEYYKSDNYDSVAIVSQHMEQLIEGRLEEVERMNFSDVKDGNIFKTAAITYFSSMKIVFSVYKEFGMQTNEEERDLMRQKLTDVVQEHERAIATMRQAQRAFADANNFNFK